MEKQMETDWQPAREPQIDYGTEVSIGSQRIMRSRQEVDPKDVPDPIIYNDEFGKTVLTFVKVGMRDGVKMYDILYRHNKKQPYSLSKLLAPAFFFHWTNFCRFAVLGSDGTPAVFVDYHALTSSRHELFALAHEIGQTHQRQVDLDLWSILGTKITERKVRELERKYPTLIEHIADLVRIRNMTVTQDTKKLKALIQQIELKPYDGFRTRGIDLTLPKFADEMVQTSVNEAPLGPTHLTQMFFGAVFKHTLPGVYLILDAMGEQRGWELALEMEKEGLIHPGFKSNSERVDFMRSGLETYDRRYNTDAYTRWLKAVW